MSVLPLICEFHPEMTEWRHSLHRHPETAFKEYRTAAFVTDLLRHFGITEIYPETGKTGVVGILRNGDGPMVGLRADMDALAIQEVGQHSYTSQTSGHMHACGHDGHMAMLLGAAKYLAQTRSFKGAIAFIFQPAEEGLAGARVMIEEGLFRHFPIETLYALHNLPELPEGILAVSSGPVMAAADKFSLTLTGRGAHAAAPHLSRDPVIAAAALIGAIQTAVSRNTPPQDTLVISVTQIHGGDVFNVIPETVELAGTVRFFRQEIGDFARNRLHEIIHGIAETYGVRADFTYLPGYPPTVNWPQQAALAAEAAQDIIGPETVQTQFPVMFAEDFSFFLQEKPGAYAFLGTKDPSKGNICPGLHNPSYDFNDRVLPIGASFLARIAERTLS